MGIIAWIVLRFGAGLPAHMVIPGKRSHGLLIICLIGVAGALGGGWAATGLFHVGHPAAAPQRLSVRWSAAGAAAAETTRPRTATTVGGPVVGGSGVHASAVVSRERLGRWMSVA
jgi:uncharacterized membrane protein YeaQ/YmgE (transglycosylase-associated protein family)